MKRIKETGIPHDLGKTFIPSKVKTRSRYIALRDEDDEILGKFDSLNDCRRARYRYNDPSKLKCEGAWRTTVSRDK